MDYFGEFEINADTHLVSLGEIYDFDVPVDFQSMTVAEYLSEQLGSSMGRGDRIHLGPIELIVREMLPENTPLVGLSLEPQQPLPTSNIPIFLNYKEIMLRLRVWLATRKENKRRTLN
ncbi:transporter associated domain-containing protein [Sneathiella glossodoripedis]|uniref:transporter associated domain-containing protein n=1 Tax=Sneathiella glossodoripedis TaxID=418853 RepID=UPI001F37ACF1|nr:transporter associated domain-containing protein [Sneathiella glossodoripedis]